MTTSFGRTGHSWSPVPASVGEVSRAVCTRCSALRRMTSTTAHVEFSLTGLTWGPHVECSGRLP